VHARAIQPLSLVVEQIRKMKYLIDIMKPTNWERVREIYLEGISTGNSTFEADAADWTKWDLNYLRGGLEFVNL
jgi:hypothetical protein